MTWPNGFLAIGLILILANVGHVTVRLLFGWDVPDDLMTLSGQLLSWPPLLGLVSIGGGSVAVKAFRGPKG
jgi:hypothetical protein